MKQSKIKNVRCLKESAVITFSDKTKLKINKNILSSYSLFNGKEVDDKLIKDLKESSKEEDLFQLVVKKINLYNWKPNKVNEFLRKNNATRSQIKNIGRRLTNINLIDEISLLFEVIEKANYKHYGYNWMVKKLHDLNVSSKTINKIKYDQAREIKQGFLYYETIKNKYNHKNNYQRKKTIFSSLLRNGFSNQISLEILNKIPNTNETHELNVLKLDYVKAYSKYKNKYSGKELENHLISTLLNKGYLLKDIKFVEELNK